MSAYIGIFLYFGLMVLAGLVFVGLSHLVQIRVKADKYDWTRPYECGIRTGGLQIDRFPIHYYLIGIMFVVFDVETIFLVPWALSGNFFKELDNGAAYWFLVMLPFFIILVIGYMYDYSTGIFDWGTATGDNETRNEKSL